MFLSSVWCFCSWLFQGRYKLCIIVFGDAVGKDSVLMAFSRGCHLGFAMRLNCFYAFLLFKNIFLFHAMFLLYDWFWRILLFLDLLFLDKISLYVQYVCINLLYQKKTFYFISEEKIGLGRNIQDYSVFNPEALVIKFHE